MSELENVTPYLWHRLVFPHIMLGIQFAAKRCGEGEDPLSHPTRRVDAGSVVVLGRMVGDWREQEESVLLFPSFLWKNDVAMY